MKNYHSSVMISSAFWLCYACLIYRSLRLAHSISLFGRRNNALGSLAEYGWTHPILKFTQLALEEESALIIQYSKLSHPVMLLHIIVLLVVSWRPNYNRLDAESLTTHLDKIWLLFYRHKHFEENPKIDD